MSRIKSSTSQAVRAIPRLREPVIRAFWAKFLGQEVGEAHEIPGFSGWWDETHPDLRRRALLYAESAWWKVTRDGRTPDEVTSAAVSAFKQEIQAWQPPQPDPRFDPDSLIRAFLASHEPSEIASKAPSVPQEPVSPPAAVSMQPHDDFGLLEGHGWVQP